jgi:hypothetical protein
MPPDVIETCSDGSCGELQLPSLLDFGPSPITLGHCYKIVNTYKLEFPSERYVNAILFLGSSQEQYQKSKGVKIILDSEDGTQIT